jgi:hypothetical protein
MSGVFAIVEGSTVSPSASSSSKSGSKGEGDLAGTGGVDTVG